MLQSSTDFDINRRRNPRKNRSSSAAAAAVRSKAKSMKKPDPNAAKITFQCTECPKAFRSEKARHGHMRLHPEREWRGIIPPLSFRRRRPVSASPYFPTGDLERSSIVVTDEEQDIADCLILLANGPNLIDRVSDCRFECSSCKRVFESHQALEEHVGSHHKNVKCCFALAKSDEETEEYTLFRAINLNDEVSMISGTARVFSTGASAAAQQGFVNLDLNLPAPVEDGSSSSYSSGLILDLRLGL